MFALNILCVTQLVTSSVAVFEAVIRVKSITRIFYTMAHSCILVQTRRVKKDKIAYNIADCLYHTSYINTYYLI